jgi:hypothetical protein
MPHPFNNIPRDFQYPKPKKITFEKDRIDSITWVEALLRGTRIIS